MISGAVQLGIFEGKGLVTKIWHGLAFIQRKPIVEQS